MISRIWAKAGTFISLFPLFTLLLCSPIKSWILVLVILIAYYIVSVYVAPRVCTILNFIMWIVGGILAFIDLPIWYFIIYIILFAFIIFTIQYMKKQMQK